MTRDVNRETPLMIAATNKHYGVVKCILGHLMDQLKTEATQTTSQEPESFILEQLEANIKFECFSSKLKFAFHLLLT